MRVATTAGHVWTVSGVRNDARHVLTIQSDIQWCTGYGHNDTGNFPAANGRFQELVSAVLQERNLINEVGKEVILDVGDRPSIVIFPSKIRVGNGVQFSCASAAVVGIIRVGISVAHLVG